VPCLVEHRASIEAHQAVVIRDDAELSRLAEEEPNHLALAQLSAYAACDHIGARSSLRAQKGLETIRIELVSILVQEDEILVRHIAADVRLLLQGLRCREELLPAGEKIFRSEAGPGRSQFGGSEQPQEAFPNRSGRGLDERPGPILGDDELRAAACVAREERNAVLEALIDDVG